MNSKIKTMIGIILFAVFLVTAYSMYTTLSENYKPNNNIEVAESTPTPEATAEDENSSEPESSSESETVVYEAPDFTIFDSQGKEIHLSDYAEKPIVLNFWASWCPPCKSEMPHFNEVYTNLTEEDNVIFMMVDLTDGSRETQADGQQYVEEQGYDFPVYFDNEQSAASAYGISSIPTTIFIDSEGNITNGYLGAIDKETLMQEIDLIKD